MEELEEREEGRKGREEGKGGEERKEHLSVAYSFGVFFVFFL